MLQLSPLILHFFKFGSSTSSNELGKSWLLCLLFVITQYEITLKLAAMYDASIRSLSYISMGVSVVRPSFINLRGTYIVDDLNQCFDHKSIPFLFPKG